MGTLAESIVQYVGYRKVVRSFPGDLERETGQANLLQQWVNRGLRRLGDIYPYEVTETLSSDANARISVGKVGPTAPRKIKVLNVRSTVDVFTCYEELNLTRAGMTSGFTYIDPYVYLRGVPLSVNTPWAITFAVVPTELELANNTLLLEGARDLALAECLDFMSVFFMRETSIGFVGSPNIKDYATSFKRESESLREKVCKELGTFMLVHSI